MKIYENIYLITLSIYPANVVILKLKVATLFKKNNWCKWLGNACLGIFALWKAFFIPPTDEFQERKKVQFFCSSGYFEDFFPLFFADLDEYRTFYPVSHGIVSYSLFIIGVCLLIGWKIGCYDGSRFAVRYIGQLRSSPCGEKISEKTACFC